MKDKGWGDEGEGMISGQAFTSCPVMLLAMCLALGTSPALWPGAPQGLTVRVLHLFTTLPRHGHHLGAQSQRLPSAHCIFRTLQYHSASSGGWYWSQPRGWSLRRSYGGNHLSIPFPSTSSPTEPPSAGDGGNTWSSSGFSVQPSRLT